jgi:hypothetical protein
MKNCVIGRFSAWKLEHTVEVGINSSDVLLGT